MVSVSVVVGLEMRGWSFMEESGSLWKVRCLKAPRNELGDGVEAGAMNGSVHLAYLHEI